MCSPGIGAISESMDMTRQVIEPDDKIDEEALHWLLEQEDPGFTSEDRKQMVAWLDADPERRPSVARRLRQHPLSNAVSASTEHRAPCEILFLR